MLFYFWDVPALGGRGNSATCYEKRPATLPLLPTSTIRFYRNRRGHPVEPSLRLRISPVLRPKLYDSADKKKIWRVRWVHAEVLRSCRQQLSRRRALGESVYPGETQPLGSCAGRLPGHSRAAKGSCTYSETHIRDSYLGGGSCRILRVASCL